MAKQAKVWDGTQWIDILSNSSKATYYQANEPTIANDGDIWIDSDDETLTATGPQGDNAGIKYKFSTSTTASDPGNTFFKFDSSSVTLANYIYISQMDAGGRIRTAWLNAWGASTSSVKGYLTLTLATANDNDYCLFKIIGSVVNNGNYYTVPVDGMNGDPFPNNAEVMINFSQTGDIGATGPTGATGTGTPAIVSTTGSSPKTSSYTLATSDAGVFIQMNVAAANTVTVSTALNTLADGSMIHVQQIGAGKTTVVAGAGTTVTGTPTLGLRAQYSSASLIKIGGSGTNSWTLVGDLSA